MTAKWTIPLAILAGGAILAIAVYLSVHQPSTSSGRGNPSAVRPVDSTDHILGNPAATLKIVTYSDFDCPHCKDFNATLRQIVADYANKGTVASVSRNFAIIELHANAKRHAEAAECVARLAGNDAYFTFTDALFNGQPVDPLKYSELAKAAGASPDQISNCIQNAASNGIDTRVDADRTNALDAGAIGTPYSLLVINGQAPIVIDGAWGYADLKDQIDQALNSHQ